MKGGRFQALIAGGPIFREAVARCARAHAAPLGWLCMAFTGSQGESEELVQRIPPIAAPAFRL